MVTPGAEEAAPLLEAQRAADRAEGVADVRLRRDRLDRAIDLLVRHQDALCEAAAADFGQRPAALTRFMDILPAVQALKNARRHVAQWVRPRRVRLALPSGVPGARAEIRQEPLGVVGVISPWNFPVALSFCPLAGIFAAGNRCLIKPSELTGSVSELMRQLVGRSFDARELAVVTGDVAVADAFSRLPFDHLLFTGSTAVGRRVMAAASDHLVPVTLELGGKSPVIVGRSASLSRVVDRVLLHKLANAGQICLAPDHVWLPRERVAEFVELAQSWVARTYPGLPANPDYTGMVSRRHAERMQTLRDDAAAQGARIIPLGTDAGPDPGSRLVCPALVLDATDSMQVMREEIFGPLLPLVPYDRLESALDGINARPKPLALYYFGQDAAEQRRVLAQTASGGVTINDISAHYLANELPFGGVGASGMGAYHGVHGFRRFSHARPVFRQTALDFAGLVGLRTPYGRRARQVLKLFIR